MKKISILICLALLVCTLGACRTAQKDPEVSSSTPQDTVSSETASVESQRSELEGIEGVVPEQEDTDVTDQDTTAIDYLDLQVYNAKQPINTDYMGFSATVYHPYSFMKDDKYGRVYTDEMLNVELSRLENFGMRYVRSRYDSRWMWDAETGWNFGSNRFKDFCTFAKTLQERDISVVLQVGWSDGFVHQLSQQRTPGDVEYLTGTGADRYGESTGCEAEMKKLSTEYQRMYKAARRYGYWASETLLQLKSRGINNIAYFSYFTEPSNGYYTDSNGKLLGAGYANKEYIFIVRNIQKKLKELGTHAMVKHLGPNEVTKEPNLYKEVAETAPELFDTLSAHFYPDSSDSVLDLYYDIISPELKEYMQILKDNNLADKKEFWMDEFCCQAGGIGKFVNDSYIGIQNVVGGIIAQQEGVDNIILWQLFDQLWIDQINTDTQFEEGVHACGHAPSLFNSVVPYDQYYTLGLFSRYNGYKNGTVYQTNLDELGQDYWGVYIGAVQLEDGDWTISIVNLNMDAMPIKVNFEKAINQTLYRHVQEGSVQANAEGRLADADKTYVKVADVLVDTVPGGSVVVYTGVKG